MDDLILTEEITTKYTAEAIRRTHQSLVACSNHAVATLSSLSPHVHRDAPTSAIGPSSLCHTTDFLQMLEEVKPI
jgi:hypothetical protein